MFKRSVPAFRCDLTGRPVDVCHVARVAPADLQTGHDGAARVTRVFSLALDAAVTQGCTTSTLVAAPLFPRGRGYARAVWAHTECSLAGASSPSSAPIAALGEMHAADLTRQAGIPSITTAPAQQPGEHSTAVAQQWQQRQAQAQQFGCHRRGRRRISEGHTTRGDYGYLMLRERIAPQPEVIRAVLLEDSPCCGGART